MMAMRVGFFSECLGMRSECVVLLPQRGPLEKKPGKYPVLYLLHGLSDDHTAWTRWTSIERYVEPLKIAVVMPNAHKNFYTDMPKQDLRYETYIAKELPQIIRESFPVSSKRKDTFIAGLSMGGYGAFKMALKHPGQYAAAASLSGALDMGYRMLQRSNLTDRRRLQTVFGPGKSVQGGREDLMHLLRRAKKGTLPRLYQFCGKEDFLYEDNRHFRELAQKRGIDLLYEEGPGAHTWDVWDRQIQRVLEWMTIK